MNNSEFEKPELLQVEDLTLKLLEANRKIKAEEEERLRIMSDIAHDLRAPVNAIRSTIDYIISMRKSDNMSEEELDKMISIMDVRTKGLQNLIQDLYFLLTLEQQSESVYNYETVELGALLEEYFYSVEIQESLKARDFQLDVPVDLNCFVNIDVEKIIRVLDNLISNAVKYSNEGDRIVLSASEMPESVVFCVKDTGIGIASENIENIFKHSYQVSKARTPNVDTGSGLGLTIVKTIIEHHGGKVWVESKINEGSEFFVKLGRINSIK